MRRLTRRPLSFRGQLISSFVGVSFIAVASVSAVLTTVNNRQAVQSLRDKATGYARLIEPQLAPVVAFNDQLTAREIFNSFATDPDVSGLAVYAATDELILGDGTFPARLEQGRPAVGPLNGHVVVLSPVQSAEGPRGTLYVSLTTRRVEQFAQQRQLMALAIALSALVLAVVVGVLLSRAVARRVGTIAAAAREVAAGSMDQPDLEPGPNDDIGQLAVAFNRMVAELRRQFVERAQLAATEQARLASLVHARTGELEESREQYRLIAESTNAIPFSFDPSSLSFTYIGPQGERLLGFPLEQWKTPGFLDRLVPAQQLDTVRGRLTTATPGQQFEVECGARHAEGRGIQLRWVVSAGDADGAPCLRGLMLDITDQRRLEGELAQAQKLESVGRLAAGVAHEINTPVQFVSDSVHFLRDGATDLFEIIDSLRVARQSILDGCPSMEAATTSVEAEARVDLPYLVEHVPSAFARSLDGLDRVATIVRSMKEFAHPDAGEMTSLDLNRAIESTLVVARSEYKYVAELETTYGDLPRVLCHAGDVNQAILNIVVNGAHAIGDVVRGTDRKGTIRVRTYVDGPDVVIDLGDTGGGIPQAIADRVFDPFFTTKEVGQGTGQGLAIAHAVIVEKHHGQLTFTSDPGRGTTFTIRLPILGPVTTRVASTAA